MTFTSGRNSPRLMRTASQRFLDQDVLTGLERRAGQLAVIGDWRADGDGVDVGSPKQVAEIPLEAARGIQPPQGREPLGVQVADDAELALGQLREIAGDVRAPVPAADDPDPDHDVPITLLMAFSKP
jgi:hypothetical protein